MPVLNEVMKLNKDAINSDMKKAIGRTVLAGRYERYIQPVDIDSWAEKLGLPWKVEGFDILDRTGNWIGEFDSIFQTEEVVCMMNKIPEFFKITDAILERKNE